jgi:hypothetical protein
VKRVIIESPYSGNVERNVNYARAALLHSLCLGEAPLASHLLYTQVLDDLKPNQRDWGMGAGWEWMKMADCVAVYMDLGMSRGMEEGIKRALALNIPVVERLIGFNGETTQ